MAISRSPNAGLADREARAIAPVTAPANRSGIAAIHASDSPARSSASSPSASSLSYAWSVIFTNGTTHSYAITDTYDVRCVR